MIKICQHKPNDSIFFGHKKNNIIFVDAICYNFFGSENYYPLWSCKFFCNISKISNGFDIC